jgi:hypothetical protein
MAVLETKQDGMRDDIKGLCKDVADLKNLMQQAHGAARMTKILAVVIGAVSSATGAVITWATAIWSTAEAAIKNAKP